MGWDRADVSIKAARKVDSSNHVLGISLNSSTLCSPATQPAYPAYDIWGYIRVRGTLGVW